MVGLQVPESATPSWRPLEVPPPPAGALWPQFPARRGRRSVHAGQPPVSMFPPQTPKQGELLFTREAMNRPRLRGKVTEESSRAARAE